MQGALYNLGPVKILVSNDDGYQAPGILALVRRCRRSPKLPSWRLPTIAAPRQTPLTVGKPVRIPRGGRASLRRGHPADCVHIAVNGLLDFRPDLVVTGVNNGSNLGDDTIYSGTVAAAMEGYPLGIPGIAMSLTHKSRASISTPPLTSLPGAGASVYDQAATDAVAAQCQRAGCAGDDLTGMRVVRLGRRHQKPNRLSAIITIRRARRAGVADRSAGKAADAGPDTDFCTVAENCVSVTPLLIDLTRYDNLRHVASWLA